MRVAGKGLIDQDRVLRFTFGGQSFEGFAGDSLASALLANDQKAYWPIIQISPPQRDCDGRVGGAECSGDIGARFSRVSRTAAPQCSRSMTGLWPGRKMLGRP